MSHPSAIESRLRSSSHLSSSLGAQQPRAFARRQCTQRSDDASAAAVCVIWCVGGNMGCSLTLVVVSAQPACNAVDPRVIQQRAEVRRMV
jgi:hypothetical protein